MTKGKMQALVYTGPNSVAFRDEHMPQPEAGEHLVRVEAVGICGSDMHAYHGYDERRPAPKRQDILLVARAMASASRSIHWLLIRTAPTPFLVAGICRQRGRSFPCRRDRVPLRNMCAFPLATLSPCRKA
jgi:Alcohol dehydrogenase GroES-like domain